MHNIEIVKKACYSEKCILSFSVGQDQRSSIGQKNSNFKVEADSIDNVVKYDGSPIFIKMDIEGSELAALKGAVKTIVRGGTMLAVCVYHKPEDLFTIPQYIMSLNKKYKLYMRHYRDFSYDTVLYAIPQ